jgi:hypothetical protein
MMRVSIWAVILATAGAVVAAEPGTKPAATKPATMTAAAAKLTPSKTPAEALERMLEAHRRGDEAALRRLARIEAPDGMAEASAQVWFAAVELHEAVRENKVARARVRDAGFDRQYSLMVPDPGAQGPWEPTRDAIRAAQWTIEGDVATPGGLPLNESTSVRKVDGGWIVVLSEAAQAQPEHVKQFVTSWMAQAASIRAATAQVRAGKLRTVGEINDFLEAERKKARAAANGPAEK